MTFCLDKRRMIVTLMKLYSGIKVPEIHGANKGINPHIKPGRKQPLLALPMHSRPPTT